MHAQLRDLLAELRRDHEFIAGLPEWLATVAAAGSGGGMGAAAQFAAGAWG